MGKRTPLAHLAAGALDEKLSVGKVILVVCLALSSGKASKAFWWREQVEMLGVPSLQPEWIILCVCVCVPHLQTALPAADPRFEMNLNVF